MKYIRILLVASLLIFSNTLALAKIEPLYGPSYDKHYDRLTDETSKSIIIPSDNYENVGYLYKKQYLFIGLVNNSKGKYLVDTIDIVPRNEDAESFLLLPCIGYCEILFKFDNNKAKSYNFAYSGASSYSLQQSQVQDFVKDMKKSKTVYTRVSSMSGYTVDYEFDLSDIEYDNLKIF